MNQEARGKTDSYDETSNIQMNLREKTCLNTDDIILENNDIITIHGNGRELDKYIKALSIDAIICDHPWKDDSSHKGGNQIDPTEKYVTFRYDRNDIKQKYRVLKEGGICVEVLPQFNISNTQYLIDILTYFLDEGFKLLACIQWIKGISSRVEISDLEIFESVQFEALDDNLNKIKMKYSKKKSKKCMLDIWLEEKGLEDLEYEDFIEINDLLQVNQGNFQKSGENIFVFTKNETRKLRPNFKKITGLIKEQKRIEDLYNRIFHDIIPKDFYIDAEIPCELKIEGKIRDETEYHRISKEIRNLISQGFELKDEYCQGGCRDIIPARIITPQIKKQEKPIELYNEIIKLISKKEEVILDQFAGSGNMGKSCKELGRCAILFEIDKKRASEIRELLEG